MKTKRRLPERECLCGCGQRFRPIRKHHVYFNDKHRRDDWAAKNSTPMAISNLRNELKDHERRLSRLEAAMGTKKGEA